MNYNDEDEKNDEGTPIIGKPGAVFKKNSPFGKSSAFSRAAGSIRERLKNLSKKDIAFVAVGMGVLVMAPVAEYMMSKPAGADQLMPGFGQRSDGGGPLYEPGINALSQGSPDGSGEVITPLSARDPASLIIGSQPAPPPPAAPQISSPPKTDFRDSMKDSARAAFSEATKAVGAPTVIPKMQNALRGMGSFGGEGSRTTGSLGGGKILNDARNASGRAASRSMVGPVASAGYKGVAPRSQSSASKGAFEKLRGQADKAAGHFNDASAIRALDRAAGDSVALGRGTGGPGGSEGEKNKPSSGSNVRDTKNSSGESLEQMAAKQRAQKALEWEFYKQYEIPKMIFASLLGSFNGVTAEFTKQRLTTALGMDPAPAKKCWEPYACKFGGADYCNDLYKKAKEAKVNPAKYICEDGGAYFITTTMGKEAASTVKLECLCGRGVDTPTYGAVKSKEDPASDKPAAANPADFADYDAILQDMVARTAETEAYPDKAEENAQSVAGGFQNLSAQANNSVKNVLLNAHNDAEKELGGYLGKINEAQAKLDGAKAQYEKFDLQIAALEKDLNAPGAKVLMQRDEAKGYEAVLDPAGKAKVAEAIKQWDDTGSVYFASAAGNLEGQKKWHAAYSAQLQLVGKGMESILETQAAIDKEVASINSGSSGMEKLKKLTGRPSSIFTASDVPLRRAASQLRATDWDTLWQKEHKLDDAKAISDEAAAWAEWKKAVSAGKQAVEAVPDSFRSNKMRSVEIRDGVKGMLPNFAQIDWDLAKVESFMPAVKKTLMGYGVSESYFSEGGVRTAALESPVAPVEPGR